MDIHLPSFNDSIAAKEALVVFTISLKENNFKKIFIGLL